MEIETIGVALGAVALVIGAIWVNVAAARRYAEQRRREIDEDIKRAEVNRRRREVQAPVIVGVDRRSHATRKSDDDFLSDAMENVEAIAQRASIWPSSGSVGSLLDD